MLLCGTTAVGSDDQCIELFCRAAVVAADDRRKMSEDPVHLEQRQATVIGSNERPMRFCVARFDKIITERIMADFPQASLDSDFIELYSELERRQATGGELSGVFSHANSRCAQLIAEQRRAGRVKCHGNSDADLRERTMGQQWRSGPIRSWYKLPSPGAHLRPTYRPGDLAVSFAATSGFTTNDPY